MSDAAAIEKKIEELEAEMARTQKNKATNYHLGTLKAKIAKLKSELLHGSGGKSAGTKNAERGFDVTKSGDTRIGLVGFPSVGKSTLLTSLTGTRSEAAAYECECSVVMLQDVFVNKLNSWELTSCLWFLFRFETQQLQH